MKKKSLITGINGFVGPYLKTELLKQEHYVSGLDRNSANCDEKNIFCADILDREKLKEIIKFIKPDYVFHLAGQSSPHLSFKNPELTLKINVEGTRNLLDAISETQKKVRTVIVSSAHVYGNPLKTPITEKEPLKITSPYAESRIKQEELIKKYPQLECIIIRAFNHIGPNQPEDFVVSAFAKQLAAIKLQKTKPIIETGNLEAARDFTHVKDMVHAYFLAASKGKTGKTYNVGYGKAYKIEEILKKLIKISGLKVEHVYDQKRMRPSDIPILECDHKQFTDDTGWLPAYTIDATLKEIFEFWEKQENNQTTK